MNCREVPEQATGGAACVEDRLDVAHSPRMKNYVSDSGDQEGIPLMAHSLEPGARRVKDSTFCLAFCGSVIQVR